MQKPIRILANKELLFNVLLGILSVDFMWLIVVFLLGDGPVFWLPLLIANFLVFTPVFLGRRLFFETISLNQNGISYKHKQVYNTISWGSIGSTNIIKKFNKKYIEINSIDRQKISFQINRRRLNLLIEISSKYSIGIFDGISL